MYSHKLRFVWVEGRSSRWQLAQLLYRGSVDLTQKPNVYTRRARLALSVPYLRAGSSAAQTQLCPGSTSEGEHAGQDKQLV